mmetsp:Transcript_78252/g.201483  ORF Transcript_78252/g.201483 Transcript_78252/m.201483 type:complete len:148 (+) Transcript_78252:2-445(+)
MLGFARLNRGKIIVEVMPVVPKRRWEHFMRSLVLDDRLEFGEGDVGLPGGIQMSEPASAHPTTTEQILRYGGSTSPSAQWPSDESRWLDDEDKLKRTEKLIEKAVKKLSGSKRRRGGGAGSMASSMSSGASSWMNASGSSAASSGAS